jgi:putative nucleotidyltransferase with HDIG domain
VVGRIESNLESWNKRQKHTNGEGVSLKIGSYTAAGESMEKLIHEADQKLLVANHDYKQQHLTELLNKSVNDRKTLSEQAILALAKSIELGDPYTSGHSERVMAYALKIAGKMGLIGPQLEVLRNAAILHDIGKIGIHKGILLKKGPLNEEEWKLMKLHPVMGAQILSQVELFKDMASIIRHHHERYDGDLNSSNPAYPDGLKGEEIPLLSRIITVADAFDAMTSSRPYRPAIPVEEVKNIFENEAGKQFDRVVTIALFSCLENDEFEEERIKQLP